MIRNLLLASCGAASISACVSGGGGNDSGRYDTTRLPTGQLTTAPFNIAEGPLDRIDLLSLLDPENRRAELQSQGLCQTHNAARRPIEWPLLNEMYQDQIDDLREQIESKRNELNEARQNNNNQSQSIKTELNNLQNSLRQLEIEAGGARLYSREGSADSSRSIDDLRKEYIVKRYRDVVSRLIEIGNAADKTEKKERTRLLNEKEELEKEAQKFGAEISLEGDLNPAVELNCAMFAFYTYYLSYPQFKFAINDLSFWLENAYLDDVAVTLSGGAVGMSAEFQEYIDELKNNRVALAELSRYEQDRLRAYLATGVYDKFYNQAAKSVAIAMRRNAVQDQIMVHSENYCRYYKATLHDMDITVNFSLGTLSTITGGLATIFTDPTTVRALAGASAVTSGVQSRFNEVMFSNLAIQTVIAGMDLARENVLREINGNRFYPLNKDDIEEFNTLPNDGVLNPGMFNTFGLRASIEWDKLYDEENDKLTYAGAPVNLSRDKVGNLTYRPQIFTFHDLLDRVALQTAAAAEGSDTKSTSAAPRLIAVNDKAQTKEDQPIDEIDVLANDEGTEGNLKITVADADIGEVIYIEENNKRVKLKYVPRANFHGNDIIRYTITDGVVVDGAERTANAIVDIRITPEGAEPPAKKYLGLASVGVYSIEAALRDSIRFQTECSLASGLTAATESLQEVRAPSIRTLTDSLEQMREMMNATEQLRRAIDRAATTDRTSPPSDTDTQ